MKNALNYYYGLDVSNVHQKDKIFYFKYEEYEYIFMICENENIESIYEVNVKLNQMGIGTHQIVLNNDNMILTRINDENYILMRVFTQKNKININDVINFNNINCNDCEKIKLIDWYTLWTNKIDYMEYQMSQMGKKYPLIRRSFSYYIGLAENAVTLINGASKDNLYYSLGHRRITCKDTIQDLYNPINFVYDLRIRDVCEYFKSCFFSKINIENEIMLYLSYNNLNYNESCYFFARMLFPTYYFDIYEKIISNEIDEEDLNNIISLVNEYEILLKRIYLYLRKKVNLPHLEWLTN